ILTPDGQSLGVLGAYLDWGFLRDQSETVQRTFARQNEAPGYDHEIVDVFVVAADGSVLVGPPAFSSPTMDSFPRLALQSLQAAQTAQVGYLTEAWPDSSSSYLTGFAKDTGFRGYPGLGWIVLVRERADQALASVAQLQVLLLGLGVVFAIIFS